MIGQADNCRSQISFEISELKALSKMRTQVIKEKEIVDKDIDQLNAEMQNAVGITRAIETRDALSGAHRASNKLVEQEMSLNRKAEGIIKECIPNKISYQYAEEHGVSDFLWDIYKAKPTNRVDLTTKKPVSNGSM